MPELPWGGWEIVTDCKKITPFPSSEPRLPTIFCVEACSASLCMRRQKKMFYVDFTLHRFGGKQLEIKPIFSLFELNSSNVKWGANSSKLLILSIYFIRQSFYQNDGANSQLNLKFHHKIWKSRSLTPMTLLTGVKSEYNSHVSTYPGSCLTLPRARTNPQHRFFWFLAKIIQKLKQFL